MVLKIPILVDRHLMSSPTYQSSSYVVREGVIRTPEQFPIYNKSLTEWSTLIATNTLLHTILGLPKPKTIADATQPTSDELSEASEDESEDEYRKREASVKMLDSVPASIIPLNMRHR